MGVQDLEASPMFIVILPFVEGCIFGFLQTFYVGGQALTEVNSRYMTVQDG